METYVQILPVQVCTVKSSHQNKELQSVQQCCLMLSCRQICQTGLKASLSTSEALKRQLLLHPLTIPFRKEPVKTAH